MHELGLAESVLEAVEQRAAGRPVARVRVRVGALLHVHPGSFDQSFALVAAGTPAEGAEVELVVVPVDLHCGGCGTTSQVGELVESCPVCGSVAVSMQGGDQVVLELLAYRQVEQPTG